MVRPALSAARGFDIIDLLLASPERGRSLSEIAKATGINLASCHAVLNVLVERGYLERNPQTRGFAPGRMLVIAGSVAAAHQPLLAQARAAGEDIVRRLDIPVAISTVIGSDIVGAVAIANSRGVHTGLQVGERRPLIPPIGTPFIAWAGDAAIEDWLARAPEGGGDWKRELRGGIANIRARGFEVLVRSDRTEGLATALNRFAGNRTDPASPASEDAGFHHLGPNMSLPASLEADKTYDVTMIAVPIFDRHGECAYNLCLGPFAEMISGTAVRAYADELLSACVAVMAADRAAA